MNGKKQLNSRRGTLLLALLVIVAVGGIIAIRLIPDETTIVKREKEVGLQMNLSHIREAIDMKRMADPTYVFKLIIEPIFRLSYKNWLMKNIYVANPLKIQQFSVIYGIQMIITIGVGQLILLLIPALKMLWMGKIASWTETKDTTVATDPSYLYDEYLDDYPNQNKLGSIYSAYGSSLKITK